MLRAHVYFIFFHDSVNFQTFYFTWLASLISFYERSLASHHILKTLVLVMWMVLLDRREKQFLHNTGNKALQRVLNDLL